MSFQREIDVKYSLVYQRNGVLARCFWQEY